MNRAMQLTNWVKSKHEGQIIKHTSEPYFNHLLAVAEMAAEAVSLGYEVGLCHDLLEKTFISHAEFQLALISFGYQLNEAEHIVSLVKELTDVFTKAAYPKLKKAVRKAKENERLIKISAGAQTVKYADLICNIGWVIKYDPVNSPDYLSRKKRLLLAMSGGDEKLRQLALDKIALFTR